MSWYSVRYFVVVALAGSPRHPDFEPGNAVGLRHGSYSQKAIEQKAAEVHAEITAVAPWLAEQHFAPAVARYLRAASREALLDAHIRQVSDQKGAGAVPSRTWEQVTAAARLASKMGQDLGLDPIGHARLKAVAANAEISASALANLFEHGRPFVAAAEVQFGEVVDGTAEDDRA